MSKQRELIDEFKKKMQEQAENRDTEAAHSRADDILCDLLRRLGYHEVVEVYEKMEKWYA